MQEIQIQSMIENIMRQIVAHKMTLELAVKLIERIQEEAIKRKMSVVIAVFDVAAHPVAIHCMDDSYIASYDVAFNKAYTAVALKMCTSELKKLSQPGEALYGVQYTNQGKIVVFGGGVPLIYNNNIIGGLGVSGGTEAEDTDLASYGQRIFEEVLTC